MKKLSTFLTFIFTRKFYHKALAYGLLILFLYLFKGFAVLFFMIFIFSYLFYSLAKFFKKYIDKFIKKICEKKHKQKLLQKIFSVNLIIILEYVVFILLLVLIISNAVPKIYDELSGLGKTIPVLQEQIGNIKSMLSDINKNYSELDATLKNAFGDKSINYDVIFSIFEKLKNAGTIIFQFVLALILSFVFLLDRNKLKKYLFGIKESNFSFLYEEYKIIFDKVIRSFGLILKAQSLIAFVNALLTTIGLFIIGSVFFPGLGYPYLLTLGLIVFVFGFIPVVGVFLSSIPIIIVGYATLHSIALVLAIVILILIIHTIEAYILNPNIVSNFLELPVSLTFIILIVGEHLFGIAGLLVGVSLFYFIVELIRDLDMAISKKHKVKKLEKKIIKRIKKSAL